MTKCDTLMTKVEKALDDIRSIFSSGAVEGYEPTWLDNVANVVWGY